MKFGLAQLALLLPLVDAGPAAKPAKPAQPAQPAVPAEPASPAQPAPVGSGSSASNSSSTPNNVPIPIAGTYKSAVNPLFPDLSTAYTATFLRTFTNFTNRAAYSEHGVEAQHFLRGQIEEATSGLNVTVSEHACGELQNNLVVRFPSSSSGPVTILGAHMDSIGSHSVTSNPYGPDVPAPGAEDNGSGVASLLDALRVLALHQYTAQSPLEFHFYAAEEDGRKGSLALASEYKRNGVRVRGMLNLDMTAYCPDEGNVTIAVCTAQTDEGLTRWTQAAIDVYLPGVHQVTAGPMESDHLSFAHAGYAVTTLVDGPPRNHGLSPPVGTMHKVTDTLDQEGFSYEHIRRFSRLAVAFAVEMTSY